MCFRRNKLKLYFSLIIYFSIQFLKKASEDTTNVISFTLPLY